MGSYFLPLLKDRHLRISNDGPYTEYRWSETVCAKKFLGLCVKHEDLEHIEHDFDLTKKEDRVKFNTMGFDCSVRERKQ